MIEINVNSTPSIEIGFERKVVDSYKAVDSELSTTSENPLMNKVVAQEFDDIFKRLGEMQAQIDYLLSRPDVPTVDTTSILGKAILGSMVLS